MHTTTSKSIIGIQILRGLAALAVVVHHAMEECRTVTTWIPDWLVLLGASGVDAFFVISGFLMLHTTLHQNAGPSAALDFLKRRAQRIFPLYWAWLLLVLSLGASGRIYRSLHTGAWLDLAAFLLLPVKKPIIGVSWTLSYEIYFYLLFAACLLWVRPGIRYLAVACVIPAIVCLTSVLRPSLGFAGEFLSNSIALEFCLGVLIAALAHRVGSSRIAGWLALVLGTAVLLLVSSRVSYLNTSGPSGPRYLLWGLPSALIVYGMLSVGFSRTSSRIQASLLLLGDSSYALYLTHPTVMIVLATMLKNGYLLHLNGLALILIATAASISLGLVVHLFVEKPLLTVAKRRWLNASFTAPPKATVAPAFHES